MMSSRRKSSTPCMVQSDLSTAREGGASDDSDDGVTQTERFPGADVRGVATATVGGASPAGVASASVGAVSSVGGGFECKYCSFRTTELKLFTDHVDLQHPTIITTSRYVCEECDYVTNSYDSLQLHNSRCHPGEDSFTVTMATQNSRTVTFRQSVNELSFSGSFVRAEEEAPLSPAHTPLSPSLSLLSPALLSSKPPAAVKLESDDDDDDEMPVLSPAPVTPATPPLASQAPPLVLANQSLVVNGSSGSGGSSGSNLKGGGVLASGTLAQVLAALQSQTQTQTQTGPAQTQLLIPLSCIPSYSPSMDQNLLLISAFNRFPYPSLSEILSLSSRTQFSEEQIRVWFSAQRLKHGVSWTPEEVEEARRKKSNGAVQQAPPTIAVIPANLTANGLQSLFQTCHIITQLPSSNANVLTQLPNANVLTQLPNANVLTQLPNANVLTPVVPSANANTVALTVAPPANSAPDSAPDSAPLPDLGPNKPKKSKEQLAELKASYARRTFATETEISRLMQVTNLSKRAIKKWFSDTRYNQRNSRDHQAPPTATEATPPIVIDSDDTDSAPSALKPGERENSRRFKEKSWEQRLHLERSFQTSAQPSEEELSRLRGTTKMTRRELQAWFNRRRQTKQSERQTSTDKKLSEGNQDRSERRRLPQGGSSKQCPSAPPPSGRPLKVKKSPEQLAVLKRAFVRSQWPTASEYDRLSSETGLPRTDIVNWFGDARYSAKNSSLKWFYLYHSGKGDAALNGGGAKRKPRKRFRGWSRRRRAKRPSVEFSTVKVKSGTWFLKDYFRRHGDLSETDLDELVSKSGLSYERVRDWFKTVRTREEQGLQGFSQSEEEEEGGPEHQENMEENQEDQEEEEDVENTVEDEETEENMEENPDNEEHMDLDSEQISQTDDDLEQTGQSQPEEAETGQSEAEEVETGQSGAEELSGQSESVSGQS